MLRVEIKIPTTNTEVRNSSKKQHKNSDISKSQRNSRRSQFKAE